MSTATTGKLLFRKVEKALEAIESASDPSSTITQTASAVLEQFSDALGVRGGRLYEHRDGGYELVRTFGGGSYRIISSADQGRDVAHDRRCQSRLQLFRLRVRLPVDLAGRSH